MRRGARLLREKKGMALLFVLCLFALLTAFGASVFFAAASAVSNATQDVYYEQARLSARSACEAVRGELTGTEASALRQTVNQLLPGETYAISAALPERMGEVSGEITRRNYGVAVVELTAVVEGKKCTLRMGFTRAEDEDTGRVTWVFAGYQQNV